MHNMMGTGSLKPLLRALGLGRLYRLFLSVLARLLNLGSPYRRLMHGAIQANPSYKVNLVKSYLRPEKIRERQQYGQWPGLAPSERLDVPYPDDIRDALDDPEVTAAFEKLDKDGWVKLPFNFADEVAELKARYKIGAEHFADGDAYYSFAIDPRTDQTVMGMLTNRVILGVLCRRFNSQPRLRHLPSFRIDRADRGPMEEASVFTYDDWFNAGGGYAMQWHPDHPNLMHVDVLVEDLDLNSTHTLVAGGSHKIPFSVLDPNYDVGFTTEVVNEAFDVEPLIGRAGDIYIWNGDALHRMNPVKGTFRSLLIFYATPGNLILDSTFPDVELRAEATAATAAADLGGFDALTQRFLETGLSRGDKAST